MVEFGARMGRNASSMWMQVCYSRLSVWDLHI